MFKWELIPMKSIGNIEFGCDREVVRSLLTIGYKEFKKTAFSKNTTDDYGGFHCFYSEDNKLEAIEIFSDCEIVYRGITIFPASINVLREQFSDLEKESDGFISKKYSIGLYAPGGTVESILLGSPGYYD